MWDRIMGRAGRDVRLARRTRQAFERLGPIFVKAGQMISSSHGSVPDNWIQEMAHCRDEVPAAPWAEVSRLITDELGSSRDRIVFIDEQPLAAASISQVHAAMLEDGSEVVIKVQRPDLARVVAADTRLLRLAARLTARVSRRCAAANPVRLVDTFTQGVYEQLSFRSEATNLSQMRDVVTGLPIKVPAVLTELSTDRVLVMERLYGVAVNDLAGIGHYGLDRNQIARNVIAGLILPALQSGVFHGDMHAGNMLALPDGRIGLLDFGVVGHLECSTQAAMKQILAACINRQFGDAASAFLRLIGDSRLDVRAVVPVFQRFLECHLDAPVAAVDVKETVSSLLQLGAENEFVIPESVAEFLKQMLYVDGICRLLDPEFNLLDDAAPIVAMACCPQGAQPVASAAA
jgi:ubiquinone biosynthesis protein